MNRLDRFSPSRIALGYIALSVLALALFAAPLWYGWNANLLTFRAYVDGEDAQRLVRVFDTQGAKGLAATLESQVAGLPGGEIRILADPSKSRLAGNLPAWPAQVPDAPGTYGMVIDIGGGATVRVVASHLKLPGGYHLLVGRESARFESLVGIFWYGIASVVAFVVLLGAGIGWLFRRAMLAEQALGRAHEELEGLVAQRTSQLECANEALRLSEQRYALAMEAAGDGHTDWIIATDEFYASPRALEICGMLPGTTFNGRSEWIARFPFHPDDRLTSEKKIDAHIAGGNGRLEMEIRILPKGELRWIKVAAICSRDATGKPVRWSGSITDITDRKCIEGEVRSRQEMLDLAQKAARAVAFDWHIDASDGENRWSPELEVMFGLTPGTYDGTFKGWKELVHPTDWPVVREAVQRANETGDVAAEYRVTHPGGVVRWLQAKGKMLFDTGGKPVRMIGFMLDVTDRHEAEDEVLRLEKQLRQAQRLEAIGTLAGGIAHDFNNILGAILGYGEMALRDAPKGSRLRRDLESISAAGERGRALVERILAFSRSGVGERVAVHVEKVVRESIDLLTASLPPGITLKADLRSDRAAMQGDPTQIHQVVMNLASNGIQAMAPGGILRVSLSALRLDTPHIATTGTVAVGDYILLRIADSGTGIPAKILERIFDPFFTTKEVGVGTGLGLSLVHGIVTEVGGAIEVATTPGEGSAFTVYLPRQGDAIEAVEAPMPDLPRGAGQRVLVVDDEEPLVRLATETLEDLGYAPVAFTSSTAALQAFRDHPEQFDAVLTDERMPRLSGSALIRELRGIRRKIPILLVSGYLGGSVAGRAYNAGADEVLKKPLLARELASSLARVLQA